MSNNFQEKVNVEMRNAKRILLLEEVRSAVLAIVFSANLAGLILLPFSGWSILFIFGVVHFGKKFKSTVKKQFLLAEHMTILKESVKEKV